MAKSMGLGDDAAKALAKLIKKMMKQDASKLKGTKPLRDITAKMPYAQGPSSLLERGAGKTKRVAKPKKPKTQAQAKSVGSMGGATTKGPKGKPERTRTPSLKGREQAKTVAEQREAERRANRLLRMNSEPKPKVVRDAKTGVSESIPVVPKRSKSRPVGRSWEHEADMMRRQQVADAKNIGRGQKGPKKKGPKKPPPDKGTGGIKVKPAPKPKKPSGGMAIAR